jgi:hypothetical protein
MPVALSLATLYRQIEPTLKHKHKHIRGAELMQCLRHHTNTRTPYDKTSLWLHGENDIVVYTEMYTREVTLSFIIRSRRLRG